MSHSASIRKRITDQIIEAIKTGTPPWRKPWSDLDTAGVPTNAVSKRRYSGVNVLLLELEKQRRGFATNWWGTFNQWRTLGGSVRKRPDHVQPGQWGTKVVFFKPIARKVTNKEGEEEEKGYALLREFVVFNIDQTEGVPLSSFGVRPQLATSFVDFAPAEEVIAASQADIRYGGDRAFYSRSGDYIGMPPKTAFTCPAEFYATTFHELVHWSECRLA
jgi:antirestriction protein ArdC